MVYYYNSKNVKVMRDLLVDFQSTTDVTPHEFIRKYIKNSPTSVEDTKLAWITDTFLAINKHRQFLQDVTSNVTEECSADEQLYCMILLQAVIFQIEPQDMELLYKCLFNLSQTLLEKFTSFLGNIEMLPYIAQVAKASFDDKYVTYKIIGPLNLWQHYIKEMSHNYDMFLKKIESRKIKLPTIPTAPKFMERAKTKSSHHKHLSLPVPPNQPPNSLRARKNMLTKSAIDQRLKDAQNKNREKAFNLLHDVKNNHCRYTEAKSEKYYKNISSIKEKIENDMKPLPKLKQREPFKTKEEPIRETAASLKRMTKMINKEEQRELQWLQELITNGTSSDKIKELEEYDRKSRERDRLLSIEKKHLMGQIAYEEAILSKKKVQKENKKKYDDFLKEKEMWCDKIETWKKEQIEKNRKYVEQLSYMELNIIQAKNETTQKKKEAAEKVKQETEKLYAEAIKVRNEELEHRVKMIQEIKILSLVAKTAKMPRIVDLTETSGIGSLCEMSMAELQERLSELKMTMQEELNCKRKTIQEQSIATKRNIEESKNSIKNYNTEKAKLREISKKNLITLRNDERQSLNSHFEVVEMKKILEQKRRQRFLDT